MTICDYVDLKVKDIISIVGAGGKTSFMFKIAEELRRNNKVLITTTTKIYVPEKYRYDFLSIGQEKFYKYNTMMKNGIYVYGEKVNEENKVIGLCEKDLDKLKDQFDYIIIEADGSKRKPIKGWKDNEPVIYSKTNKTVGVLDIKTYKNKISNKTVHNCEQFCKITNSEIGKLITFESLSKMITNPNGMFKASKGEKILFVNKAEDTYYLNKAYKLRKMLYEYYPNFLDQIIIGSMKKNIYFK